MRNNSKNRTIERNLAQKWRFLIGEFELVKPGKHPQFRFLEDSHRFHGANRQPFYKYCHRFKQDGTDQSLLPRKRGPSGRAGAPSPSSPMAVGKCPGPGSRGIAVNLVGNAGTPPAVSAA